MTICPSCQAENDDAAEACSRCGQALSPLVKGAILASRYEILGALGKGGMGVVYKAYDRELEETVALKVLRGGLEASQEMARRFRSEIKLARKVRHRNVCAIHEFGQDGPMLFIAMELIDGLDLKHVLLTRGALPPGQAYDLAAQAADGLQAIHDEGIIHRDLKTTNIMLDGRGLVRLMDFGIAKQWRAEGGAGVTGTGQIVGTPEYMSPEQVRGHTLDFRSDVYSLGIVVYELVTGRVPYRGDSPVSVMLQHLEAPLPLGGPASAGLPRELMPILRKALAQDPADRFPKARAMAQALRQAASRAGPAAAWTAVPTPTATLALPSPTRSGRRADILALTAAVLLVAGALAYRRWTPEKPPGSAADSPADSPAAAPLARPPATLAPPTTLPPASSTQPSPAPSPTPAPRKEPNAARPEPPTTGQARPADAALAEARQRELREAADRTNDLLDRAEKALVSQQPDIALGLYDEVLELDPQNPLARMGRLTAINARAAAAKAASDAAPPASFVSGKTQAESVETRAAAAPPAGFDPGSGITVTRSTEAAALPGLILFEVEPQAVRPGDKYTVRIVFVNGGAAPIEIRTMSVTTLANGGKAGGPVSPLARVVAPRDRAVLLSPQGAWKDDVKSWSMQVAVHTAQGETYKNELRWK